MQYDLPFAEAKNATKLWLAGTPAQNYRWPHPPDQNIAPLIAALNELPFLYTYACCGGHIRTKREMLELLVGSTKNVKVSLGETFGCYSGPWFSFTTDGSAESARFVEALRRVVGAWGEASFEQLPMDEHTFGVNFTETRGGKHAESFIEACALEQEAEKRMDEVVVFIHRFMQ